MRKPSTRTFALRSWNAVAAPPPLSGEKGKPLARSTKPIPRYVRPKARRKVKPRTLSAGGEVCSEKEYRRRTLEMRNRQGELCGLCGQWMHPDETTFDHEKGRTRGLRDDRIVVDGKRKNAAVHLLCNGAKGSRRVKYVVQ